MTHPLDWLDDALLDLDRQGLRRRLLVREDQVGSRTGLSGASDVISFASNDYLGLASDIRLRQRAAETAKQFGWGSGASPLLGGRAKIHDDLERCLAEFEGTEKALLFPSGFAANAGPIPALASAGDAIFSDAKNHASIVDGCRLSKAECHIYPHRDCEALQNLLETASSCRRKLIVTDALFSMDGDLAPLPQIAELASIHGAMLLVDEAHATGVFGATGRGVVEEMSVEAPSLPNVVTVKVGTLSKALGSAGGFVCGDRRLVEWLVNRARSYVFSTAQPVASSAAAQVALRVVCEEPQRRVQLLGRAKSLRKELRNAGWETGASQSQIIPLRIGSVEVAQRLAERLWEDGIYVPAIRPPSVPTGESLLRISLCDHHTDDDVAQLLRALERARDDLAVTRANGSAGTSAPARSLQGP